MVDQSEENAIDRIKIERPQSRLEGSQHSETVITIDHSRDAIRGQRCGGITVEAKNRDERIAKRLKGASQRREEGSRTKRKKCLGTTHALRFASGQNDARCFHFSRARRRSQAKIDFESERQFPSGSRLIAIISAATEIAISSGVTAPISKTMGAYTLSNAERGTPSFSSSLTTPIVLRLLPIIAT